ncbi:MAG: DUF3021 domain-containing protein [Lachnospiraceae bacterium]|nr:DUF3021 domain-containing protein [Lachnospiraceae bacterium]
MELKSRFLIYSLIGIVVGMIVGIIMWMLANPGNPEGRSFVLHMIASGIHGMIPCGAMTVYAIESWGLTKSTLVHAAITLATILLIELPMKWFTWSLDFVAAMVIYVVIYAIIWLSNYLYWKHTVNEMNDQLEIILKRQKA